MKEAIIDIIARPIDWITTALERLGAGSTDAQIWALMIYAGIVIGSVSIALYALIVHLL